MYADNTETSTATTLHELYLEREAKEYAEERAWRRQALEWERACWSWALQPSKPAHVDAHPPPFPRWLSRLSVARRRKREGRPYWRRGVA